MTMTRAAFAVVIAASLSAVAPAHAQPHSAQIVVDGNVKVRSVVETAIAIGNASTPNYDASVVYELGAPIKGDVTMVCTSTVQAAIAIGIGSHASASQGCLLGGAKR